MLYFLLSGDLVQQGSKKMPYVKIEELGIVMEGLRVALTKEIGDIPRKPSFYGNSQKRKLWESRNVWKLGVLISTPSTSITTSSTSMFTPASTPGPSAPASASMITLSTPMVDPSSVTSNSSHNQEYFGQPNVSKFKQGMFYLFNKSLSTCPPLYATISHPSFLQLS